MQITTWIKLTGSALLITLTSILSACNTTTANAADPAYQNSDEIIQSITKEDLSEAETEGMIYMREEEKLARDVYITLYNKWGMRIFTNISNAEQRHTDAIQVLLTKYELDDPIVSDSIGAFTNTTLAELYTTLTQQGSTSLVEALKVGALIEEIDILDLKKELDETVDNEDIKYVYGRLLNGSYNHLRAFVRNLSVQGVTYAPVKLTTEEYQTIINN